MLRLWTFLVSLLAGLTGTAQTELQFGPLNAGFANGSSINNNPFAIFSNPATAPQEANHLGVWVSNRFGVQDLAVLGISYQYKGLGLGFRTSGNQFLSEYNPSLSYALNVTPRMRLGAGINGFISRVSSESMVDNRTQITGNLGVYYQFSEQLAFGGTARNFIQSDTDRNIKKQEYLGFAVNYSPDSLLSFHGEVFSAFTNTLAFRFAINYTISPQVSVRYGLVNNPFSNHLGLQLVLGKVQVFLAASYQNNLGFSPDVGAVYPFTNPKALE